MDWSITLLLAAVLLLDGGVQRIGSPSLVLRRAWSGPWRVARVLHVSGWRTIGVWPSAVITLVLTETDAAPAGSDGAQALDRVRRHTVVLRVLGFAVSVLLVFGAPFAASRYGAFGVLVVLGMLLVLGSATALVAGGAVRRCGLRGARLWRFALPLVSPFSAPYAPDRVLAVAARGRSPLESARYLMGEPEFARWSRPHVFDALAASRGHRDGPAPDATAPLLEGFSYQLTAGALERLLGASAPEVQTGSAFCPRCGLEYRASQAVCDDCGGIALAIAGAADENTR